MKHEIIQADREAAQALCASGWTNAIDAFAAHRIATERRIVGYLWERWRTDMSEIEVCDIADSIEAGAHRDD